MVQNGMDNLWRNYPAGQYEKEGQAEWHTGYRKSGSGVLTVGSQSFGSRKLFLFLADNFQTNWPTDLIMGMEVGHHNIQV